MKETPGGTLLCVPNVQRWHRYNGNSDAAAASEKETGLAEIRFRCTVSRINEKTSVEDDYTTKNNGDRSISLKFTTDYDHVTHNVPQTLKFKGSKVKVTAWHFICSKNAISQERIIWLSSNLVNYLKAERNQKHVTQVQGH